MPAELSDPEQAVAVPLPRVASFVRQVTHDVRNTLNSLDLQAAYLLELSTDPEAVEELKRMRSLIHDSARDLQGLSSNFRSSAPSLIPYEARILVEDFRDRLHRTHPEQAGRIEWEVDVHDESVLVDIEMFFGALVKVVENTFTFSQPDATISANVFIDEGRLFLDLSQPSEAPESDPARWGREPFVTTRRGGYGLGLFRARGFLASHGGDLSFRHDSGRNLLLTRVSLPLASNEQPPALPDSHH